MKFFYFLNKMCEVADLQISKIVAIGHFQVLTKKFNKQIKFYFCRITAKKTTCLKNQLSKCFSLLAPTQGTSAYRKITWISPNFIDPVKLDTRLRGTK